MSDTSHGMRVVDDRDGRPWRVVDCDDPTVALDLLTASFGEWWEEYWRDRRVENWPIQPPPIPWLPGVVPAGYVRGWQWDSRVLPVPTLENYD